jgi:hypothetical protein
MLIAAHFFGCSLAEGLGRNFGLVTLHKVEHFTEGLLGLTETELAAVIFIQAGRTIDHQFCEFLEVQILLASLSVRRHIVFEDLGLVSVN